MGAASFKSFPEMFLHRVSSTPDTDAFYYPDANDEWQTLLWKDVGERARNIAGGLRSLGLELEQRCAILCNTRVEWILVDVGIACGTGATTTIYPSNTAEECAFIISDSDTRFVFAEDNDQVDKLLTVRGELPQLEKIIVIDGTGGHDGFVISLSELEELGKAWHAENAGAYEEGISSVESHHLCTLIYTSGTTGKSKGVELTQDCWVFEGEAMDNLGFMSPADKQFLWLPLAHSFGKVLEAALIRIGVPTAIDGRIDRIVQNLGEVQPTFVAAVPRIFEKVYNKIVTGAKDAGGLKYKIFTWSLATGRAVSQLKQKGQQPSAVLALKFAIAEKLVFSKIQTLFGGKLRFFISGSAPLNREIAEFFHAAGMLILEGYGLTETSAASYVNRPDKYKFGTVGVPLPGVEVKIDDADGEILLRGRGNMRGYRNRPEVNAETLTEDLWLRTGDIGEIDADGFLKITDRKKDLIKTSGGKYVAPQELEGRLKVKCGLLAQVLVHGNARNFCTALVTIDEDTATKWANENDKAGKAYKAITEDPDLHAAIQVFVDELNSELPRYSTIKKFSVLPQDFAIETGELTPSMKVKRKVVEKRYADVLDGFYAGALQDM